jgi:membrane protease YdiL (CAAX protease family)
MSSQYSQNRSFLTFNKYALIALCLLAPVPTLGVWFAAFSDNPQLGSFIWSAAKVILLLGPIAWWILVQREPLKLPVIKVEGLLIGLISGAVLALVIFSSYWFIARPVMSFEPLQSMLQGVGINSVKSYLLLALYLTLINSLIEEYVFRWFFYSQLERLMPSLAAVFVSALIFTIHHTVVLVAYVPWHFNALASIGVFTGGLIWSYLYYRYGHIWPSYLSHIGADIGVFCIGYHALFVAT